MLTPEQFFLTAVDDALDARRAVRIDKLIRAASFTIPTATIAETDYREGRGLNPTWMRRYAAHDWRAEPTNLLVHLTYRRRQDLPRLRHRDRRLPQRT